jgi:peptidoglycan/xylan/chitin deacetylase (PgdA/CDA1 family)/SAM-dependent methyltransferase
MFRRTSTPTTVDHFNQVFSREDPWNYSTSPYELRKYSHTLEMIPGHCRRALEIGCAEGIFTERLAAQTEHLVALDISERALARARSRLTHLPHVALQQWDIENGLPEGQFDLIVCSEVLSYMKNRFSLAKVAQRIANSLADNGILVLTHATAIADNGSVSAHDFNEVGGEFIGQTFARIKGLDFSRELRTTLYRVQVFEKTAAQRRPAGGRPREVLVRPDLEDLSGLVTSWPFTGVKRGGAAISRAEARHCWRAPGIPILMYHRVCQDGPQILAPYRVSPRQLERQLAFLQRHGFESISVAKCFQLLNASTQPPKGRYVVLTFDDAYLDFFEVAWPLLRSYGFGATVFVPTSFVGGAASWDAQHGPPAPLMSWDHIRELADQGVEFGAHGHTHTRLPSLSYEAAREEAQTSGRILREELRREVSLFSYPFNARNPQAVEAIRSSGFSYAVTAGAPCGRGVPALEMPRIEVLGTDSMETFIEKLGPPVKAPLWDRARYRVLRMLRDRRTYMPC